MRHQIKLPKKIIEKLKNLPEAGMGYQIVNFKMKNGKILENITVFNSSIANIDNKINIFEIADVILSINKD
jgi:hypothetical protein